MICSCAHSNTALVILKSHWVMPEQPGIKCEYLLLEAGCNEKVVAHCRAVRDVALEYARSNHLVSAELVEKGARLHDIGRGRNQTIRHAQLGADLLRARGYSGASARLAACHTRAGLPADECTLLRLSPRDRMPQR